MFAADYVGEAPVAAACDLGDDGIAIGESESFHVTRLGDLVTDNLGRGVLGP